MTAARLLVTFFSSGPRQLVVSAIERGCRSRMEAHDARLGILALKTRLPDALAP
jgi:hypothetical protein